MGFGSLRLSAPVDGKLEPVRRSVGSRASATGFSSAIDLAFGPDGTLYVLETAKEGLLDIEFLGGPPIGALWAVETGTQTELAPGELLFPGGVAVDRRGALDATTGPVFGPGAGALVHVES